MKLPLLLLSLLLISSIARAQALDGLIADYQLAVAELEVKIEQEQRAITISYTDSLERAKKNYQSQGQLQGVLAINDALEQAKIGGREVIPGPKSFVNQQKKYFSASIAIENRNAPKSEHLRQQMLGRLSRMQKELVRNGKIEEAVAIREEMKRLHSTAPIAVRAEKTEIQLKPEADARVEPGDSEPEGLEDKLSVMRGGEKGIRISFMRFDLSKLRGPIRRVELRLYCDVDKEKFKQHPRHDIHLVEDVTWNERTINGNAYPKISDTLLKSFSPPPVNQYVYLDLTEAANAALTKPHRKLNIALSTQSTSGVYIAYSSREHTQAERHPVLIINPPRNGVR